MFIAGGATAQGPELVVETSGRLIVFETNGMTCSLYVNTEGIAAGSSSISCVPTPSATTFRVLKSLETTPIKGK